MSRVRPSITGESGEKTSASLSVNAVCAGGQRLQSSNDIRAFSENPDLEIGMDARVQRV